jgi:hypothetical protein
VPCMQIVQIEMKKRPPKILNQFERDQIFGIFYPHESNYFHFEIWNKTRKLQALHAHIIVTFLRSHIITFPSSLSLFVLESRRVHRCDYSIQEYKSSFF